MKNMTVFIPVGSDVAKVVMDDGNVLMLADGQHQYLYYQNQLKCTVNIDVKGWWIISSAEK